MSNSDSPDDATSRLRDRWRDDSLQTHSKPTNEVAPLPDNSGLPDTKRTRVKTGSGEAAAKRPPVSASSDAPSLRATNRRTPDDDTASVADLFRSKAPTSRDIATALVFGAITAAVAVAIEVAIEFSVFYFYIVPIGPFALGVLSGLGAALVARHHNLTITWGLWGAVGAITAVSYFIILGLQHASFNTDYSLSFFDWFTLSTELMSISDDGGFSETELGNLGYVFRLLDFVGIVAGSLFIMLQLKKNPYEDV